MKDPRHDTPLFEPPRRIASIFGARARSPRVVKARKPGRSDVLWLWGLHTRRRSFHVS
ncbi:MAG: hypothetical protein HC765_06205 [Brachymonas sp.]|nr:hypothetical protein [Brachymonas sp.]